MTSDADLAVKPLQALTEVAAQLLPPEARDTPQTLGSRSPVRLGIPGFLLSKVSQKVTVPPNCMLQFPLTGVGVDGDGPAASTAGETSTKSKSAIVEASALASPGRALRSDETETKH